MKRTTGWMAGVGVGVALLALSCSGTEVLGEGAGGSPGAKQSAGGSASVGDSASVGGSTAVSGDACETACVQQMFKRDMLTCKLCHGNAIRLGDLDIESPNPTARLKDVPAKHAGLALGMTAADCPMGDKLIDTANPDASWLLKKIRGEQGNCGTSMPQTGTLTTEQKACITSYVYCVAGR